MHTRIFTELDQNPKHQDYIKDKPIYTILIFVLDETTHVSNFSLNGYKRSTNPLLGEQDIVYFNETTSCGTETAISVPYLFSQMLRSNFNSADSQFTENLIDFTQKAGYPIIWKENND